MLLVLLLMLVRLLDLVCWLRHNLGLLLLKLRLHLGVLLVL